MAANRRKILVPLATLMVAGAVAVGSGASFTSTTASTTAVSSGNVTHANDVTRMDITNIKDGDTIRGEVTITNTGTIDSTLTIAETDFVIGDGDGVDDKGFLPGDLTLTLIQDGNVAAPVYSNDFGGMTDDATYDLGELPVGESTTIEFVVVLDEATDNTNENASATAAFQWVSTQVDGEDLDFVTNVLDGITFGD